MRTLSFLTVILFTVIANPYYSQSESAHWFFGPGLDFSSNPPLPDNNGRGPSGEGSAAISDASGNLLFYMLQYSTLDTIWNKAHQAMANGGGIIGDPSSSQSSLILKKPGSGNIYYLFSQSGIDGASNSAAGLRYSEIDMSLAGGNGSVTAKNVPLAVSAYGQSEKLTAVRHCNGTDIWLLSHDNQVQNRFRCFLITAAGIGLSPVLSVTGLQQLSFRSCMKVSPNGRKICYVGGDGGTAELFDFDPSSGTVSNPVNLNTLTGFGCEFSPDGTKLYVSSSTSSTEVIYQWDVCAGSNAAIVNSRYLVANEPWGTFSFGSIQNALNGKVYVATLPTKSVSVIHNPNVYGAGCNFQLMGQPVGNKVCQWALPNFLSSYFKSVPPAFTYTAGACTSFSFSAPLVSTVTPACSAANPPYTGMSWDFGDPASGAANLSSLANPSHNFSSAGTYHVKLILNTACGTDTLRQTVNVTVGSGIGISGTGSICAGAKAVLTASGASAYNWSTGATTATISVQPPVTSTYVVSVTVSPGCVVSRTHTVVVKECVGVDGQDGDKNIIIYPNPSSGTFYIRSPGHARLTIYDAMLKSVHVADVSEGASEITIPTMAGGVYFASFKTSGGTRFVKLVINKTE